MKQNEFKVFGRPGYFGKKKDKIFAEYDAKFGECCWEVGWAVGKNLKWDGDGNPIKGRYIVFDFPKACKLYEDAYHEYFQKHETELQSIVESVEDVYDNAVSNIHSGLDYNKQEPSIMGLGTHIQDIAIRNVVARFGMEFEGEGLLQIRTGGIGERWNPAHIPFHKPEWIMQPKFLGWWDKGVEDSVECWYQSNKVLLIKE